MTFWEEMIKEVDKNGDGEVYLSKCLFLVRENFRLIIMSSLI